MSKYFPILSQRFGMFILTYSLDIGNRNIEKICLSVMSFT